MRPGETPDKLELLQLIDILVDGRYLRTSTTPSCSSADPETSASSTCRVRWPPAGLSSGPSSTTRSATSPKCTSGSRGRRGRTGVVTAPPALPSIQWIRCRRPDRGHPDSLARHRHGLASPRIHLASRESAVPCDDALFPGKVLAHAGHRIGADDSVYARRAGRRGRRFRGQRRARSAGGLGYCGRGMARRRHHGRHIRDLSGTGVVNSTSP